MKTNIEQIILLYSIVEAKTRESDGSIVEKMIDILSKNNSESVSIVHNKSDIPIPRRKQEIICEDEALSYIVEHYVDSPRISGLAGWSFAEVF